MTVDAKPTFYEYAVDLVKRLEANDPLVMPGVVVIGLLGYAAEDERLPDYVRAEAKHWASRLVDEEGNPLDSKGRNALEYAFEENALNQNGTLSSVLPEDDRATVTITVLRRASEKATRDALRAKLAPHFESYLDYLLDDLYGTTGDSGALQDPSPSRFRSQVKE